MCSLSLLPRSPMNPSLFVARRWRRSCLSASPGECSPAFQLRLLLIPAFACTTVSPQSACSARCLTWALEVSVTSPSQTLRTVSSTDASPSPVSSPVVSQIVSPPSHVLSDPHPPLPYPRSRRLTVLGPRLTLFFGTLGYALYVGSLWWYVDPFRPSSCSDSLLLFPFRCGLPDRVESAGA